MVLVTPSRMALSLRAIAVLALAAAAVHAACDLDGGGACSDASQCWYNGRCVSGKCVCSDAWTGEACNVLVQGPSVQLWPNPALPLPADERVTDSWGVTIAQDPATLQWSLYACVACVFAGGKPQPFSMHGSGIIRAHGPALEGPFEYDGEFEGIFSEGPHMVRAPDGTFVLITPSANSSSAGPVVCTGDYRAGAVGAAAATAGAAPPLPRFGNVVNKSTIFSSRSPAGPWVTHNFSLAETGPLTYFSNPSLAIDGVSGEALLAWRVNLLPPVGRGETLGFATAPSWDAPRYTAVAEPLRPGLVGYEDPFIWSHDGVLSMLAHSQHSQTDVGALFVSADAGRTWALSPVAPYTTTVPSMTGTEWGRGAPFAFLRRERPELLFDASGAITHLLTGAMRGGAGPQRDWQLSYSIATRVGKAAVAAAAAT